jgi:hypothetical protein
MKPPPKNLVDQLVEAYLPPAPTPPEEGPLPAERLMNLQWPEAGWDVSGAFVHDTTLGKLLELFVHEFNFLPFRQVSGAPACIWAGGRSCGPKLRPPVIQQIITTYDTVHVSVNLAFSNCLLRPEHLGDMLGNYILTSLCDFNRKEQNGVVLGSDILADHVRKNYPSLKRIASIARVLQEGGTDRLETYRRLADQYDQVIIHPDDNFNLGLLEKLEDKDKYKIVLNECCIHNCPQRRQHYELVSAQFLNFLDVDLERQELELVRHIGCGHNLKKLLLSPQYRTVTLSTDECRRIYDLGFRNFKIQGRGLKTGHALLFQITRWLLNDDPRTDYTSSRLIMRLFDA